MAKSGPSKTSVKTTKNIGKKSIKNSHVKGGKEHREKAPPPVTEVDIRGKKVKKFSDLRDKKYPILRMANMALDLLEKTTCLSPSKVGIKDYLKLVDYKNDLRNDLPHGLPSKNVVLRERVQGIIELLKTETGRLSQD